jgi:hypothetical protein
MKQSAATVCENLSTRLWSLMALGSCCVFVASLNNVYDSEPDAMAVNSSGTKAFVTEFGLVFPEDEIADADTEEYFIEARSHQKNTSLKRKPGNVVLDPDLNDINFDGRDVLIDDLFYNELQLQLS